MNTNKKNDISNLTDVKLLVDSFYGKVRKDPMLKDIFNNKIEDRWPEHLEKMYRFWQTGLLEEHTYKGSPFVPQAPLPVSKEHFDSWISLFFSTVDELFAGEKAERAKWQGGKMAEMFQYKIDYYRGNPAVPLL